MDETQAVVQRFTTKYGHAPTRVDNVVLKLGGGLPGGTVDTVVNVIESGGPRARPAKKNVNAASKEVVKGQTILPIVIPRYLENVQSWTVPWVMGSVNSATVKRSNAALGFAPKLTYYESQAVPSVWAILAAVMPVISGLTLFVLPPVRALLFNMGALPRPGDGPSRDQMERGSYDFRLIASDDEGQQEVLRFAGLGDPGCLQTAILQGEVAYCLAVEYAALDRVGAGLTPGIALGQERLVPRLRATGRILIE